MPVREASGEVRLAELAFRNLGLIHILVVLALAGCSYVDNRAPRRDPGRPGIHHVVKKGENLFRIGKAYGVGHMTLARVNRIPDASDIKVGRRIFVPGATRPLPVEIITPIKAPAQRSRRPARTRTPKTAPGKKPQAKASRPDPAPPVRTGKADTRTRRRTPSRQGFVWPVEGKVTGKFDSRHESLNDGINIAAPSGTPVRATLGGQVIYSDNLRGYGNLIILRHRRGFASVYAHNRKNLVRQGQKVDRRQVIAEVGATGRAATPYLHFEIRRNNVARDPLSYLP